MKESNIGKILKKDKEKYLVLNELTYKNIDCVYAAKLCDDGKEGEKCFFQLSTDNNIIPIISKKMLNALSEMVTKHSLEKNRTAKLEIASGNLIKIISSIIYNDNLVLDKKGLIPDKNKPVLDIYISSDDNLDSVYNQTLITKIKEDKDIYKIIIGKAIAYKDDKVIRLINNKNFYGELKLIKEYLVKAINKKMYSEINIYYYNYIESKLSYVKAFPLKYEEKYQENVNYLIETDLSAFIIDLIAYYVCYQLEICEVLSQALN